MKSGNLKFLELGTLWATPGPLTGLIYLFTSSETDEGFETASKARHFLNGNTMFIGVTTKYQHESLLTLFAISRVFSTQFELTFRHRASSI
jgi:hypothetical protein